jgi:NADH:ubiquinone reductase (H+-translocating)
VVAKASSAPRVVIIGAGFAGMAAARALTGSGADVLLVDRNVYSTFQPLLYQVATGGLNPGDVSYPIRSFTRKVQARFRRGEVVSIDSDGQQLVLRDGGVLPFDYLVVATGSTVNHFGIPGAAEHSFSLYRRGDALSLRDQLMGGLESFAAGKAASVTIVIIGGGATGVEMAGTLAELRDGAVPTVYPEIDPATIRVILVEQGPEVLGPFDSKLRQYALRQLQRRRVEVWPNTSVSRVESNLVTFEDGRTVEASLIVWAAGVAAKNWGLPQGRGGRIAVRDDLRVFGHDHVFAIGDVAITSDDPLPQLAQPAIQSGRHAGLQIRRLIEGRETERLHYHDKGTMATIGRRAAVVQLPGDVRLTGTLAWLAWLALHIVTLLGGRNRVSALLNLSWRYVSWPSGNGVIVGDIPEPD